MGLELLPVDLHPSVNPAQVRAAAVHVADRVGADHPHLLDDTMPRLAGRLTARQPGVPAELLDLLDTLGLHTTTPGGTA